MVRVFASGLGDLGSIPGRVIPKTQKWYLIPSCLTLSIIRCRSRLKWSNTGKGVAPSPTSWCSSNWKGSLWVTLDYSRQLYLLYLYFFLVYLVSVIWRYYPNVNHELIDPLDFAVNIAVVVSAYIYSNKQLLYIIG